MKRGSGFLLLPVKMYRLCVLLTWGTSAGDIAAFCRRRGVQLAEDWQAAINGRISTERPLGLACNLGSSSGDFLVWLREKPAGPEDYKTVLHELYHAVDLISEDRNLAGEREARAYLYGFLVDASSPIFQKQCKQCRR